MRWLTVASPCPVASCGVEDAGRHSISVSSSSPVVDRLSHVAGRPSSIAEFGGERLDVGNGSQLPAVVRPGHIVGRWAVLGFEPAADLSSRRGQSNGVGSEFLAARVEQSVQRLSARVDQPVLVPRDRRLRTARPPRELGHRQPSCLPGLADQFCCDTHGHLLSDHATVGVAGRGLESADCRLSRIGEAGGS